MIRSPFSGINQSTRGSEGCCVALSNLAGFWNWNVIVGVLNEVDEQEVHKLTTIDVEEEDRVVWKFNNKCIYTMKSAYWFAMESV
ncbi:hypothetical protein TSUD_52090 [Trifolium subterraneum]|uniref:Uncharacterized protein n=1 Tax=Trifolium subterraneum TaxID=3900 RepID=A0A2Z6M7D0_TRISU|nr:hypothetical protein TSUD_52090 [Trifolium subterraneum]